MVYNIDVVYTYVNYRDKKWLNKYKLYNKNTNKSVRYFSLNELELSVKHTLKYCKFIKNIYIVTDNQIPYWYDKELYPNVFIIDQKTIFTKECSHPNYNSNTIEAMLDNIPNLSEMFLYLNDDMFINLDENDLFDNDGLPLSLFLKRSWDFNLEKAKLEYKNNPAVFSLYKTIKLAEKYFNKNFNVSYTHQCYILTKKGYSITKQIFNKEYKDKIKLRFREHLSESDLVFPLLVNIVSTELKITKFKYLDETKLTKLFFNYVKDENKVFLQSILNQDLNLFCINDVVYDNDIIDNYYSFSKKFREKISDVKDASYISFNNILLINIDTSKEVLDNFNQNLYNNDFIIERISEFDEDALSDNAFSKIKNDTKKFKGICSTKKEQYKYWISHIKCYKYIIDNAIEWSLIMEDDAYLKPNLNKEFKNFLIPTNADIIYINFKSNNCKSMKSNVPGFEIYIDGWGASGYIISYNCAKKILDSIYSKIYYLPIDTLLNKLGRNFKNSFTSSHRNAIKDIEIVENLNLNLYITDKFLLK